MSTTTPVAQPEKRLYYLDWLRVLIIGGVFLAHTVLPFTGGDWLIVSGSLIPIAGAIAIIGNQFGMPLLFLISGAATVFSMRRRTNQQYARERFFRLIIPYIVLTLILSPMQAYYQALDHGWYSGSFIGYLPEFFNLHGITGFNLQWAGRYGFHLWFLVFLFFYSIVTIPLFTYLRSEKGKRWFEFFDRLFRLPGAIVWAPGALMGVITGIVYAFFPGYQNWGDTVYWGLFFVYGYILYSDPRLLERVRRSTKAGVLWIVLSIVALVAVALLTLLSIGQISNLNEVGQLPTMGISIVIYLILCLNSWAFMILFLALGMRFLDFTNRAIEVPGRSGDAVLSAAPSGDCVHRVLRDSHSDQPVGAAHHDRGERVPDHRRVVSPLHPPLESAAHGDGHVAPEARHTADHAPRVGGAGRVWRRGFGVCLRDCRGAAVVGRDNLCGGGDLITGRVDGHRARRQYDLRQWHTV